VFTNAPEQRALAERAHWVGRPFADAIADVRAFVVHETSGWPTRLHGGNMFDRAFFGGATHAAHTGEVTQLYVAGDGTVMLGMTLPLQTFHANFVNAWSLGSETGHAWGNYAGNEHLGPFSQSDHTKNAAGEPIPPYGAFRPLHAMPVNGWTPLSANAANVDVDDYPGLRLWFRHAGLGEVVVTLWTTERYAGPWRQPQRVCEMLFSEAQYRSWALLLRFIAERFLVPRNFPVLPHKMRSSGFGTAGNHGMLTDALSFRSIVRADEILFRSLATFGITEAQLNNDADVTRIYRSGLQQIGNLSRNQQWTRVFDRFRGFHGHGFSGDPTRGRDHDCPGPMFDWHRLAREVWDWWWHPFDFDAAQATTNVPRRAYSHDWDGNTLLTEHFFNTPAATYRGRAVPGIHGNTGSPRTYRLERDSPVYALANGELVAARFPPETGDVSLAFILVRHEIFHQPDILGALPDIVREGLDLPPGLPDRISYDDAPSTVYTLYMHLGRPAGMSFNSVTTGNPDWLYRLIMRTTESENGVNIHNAHPPTAAELPAWNSVPPGAGSSVARRPTVLEGWTMDAQHLRRRLDQLSRGELMIAPSPDLVWVSPIRVLLGDFLGIAGVISRTHAATTHGVRVEVFSRNVVSSSDFDFNRSNNRWDPPNIPLRPRPGGHALFYSSEWWDIPEGNDIAAFQVNGVDVSLLGWMNLVEGVTIFSRLYPEDGRLPRGFGEVHYDPDSFMQWLNDRTWHSEWPKYRLKDAAGAPLATPAQPRPRTG